MKNLKKRVVLICGMVIATLFNTINAFATSTSVDAPTLTEVRSIVDDGLELFFGALAAFAVIMGGVEFYKGFISFKDSADKGGYGESKSSGVKHVIAGVFCLIGGIIIFVVLGWTKDLFGI